jgi:hypothetical protein
VVLAFAALEYQGLPDPSDLAFTLTNRVRRVMAAHPASASRQGAPITVGLVWLAEALPARGSGPASGVLMDWRDLVLLALLALNTCHLYRVATERT